MEHKNFVSWMLTGKSCFPSNRKRGVQILELKRSWPFFLSGLGSKNNWRYDGNMSFISTQPFESFCKDKNPAFNYLSFCYFKQNRWQWKLCIAIASPTWKVSVKVRLLQSSIFVQQNWQSSQILSNLFTCIRNRNV